MTVVAEDALLAQVRAAVEAFVRRSTDHEVDDVVQEALTRLLENRHRLEPAAWASYGVVSARNLLRERERAGAVHRRHAHRLHSPDVSAGPEEQLLTQEEHAAVRRAIATLDTPEAGLLVEHYSGSGRSNRSIAPATAARLARARAKLRVAYVLEHSGLTLPTSRCRPVLEAVSSGDRRRQERLGAGRHLLACRACASCAPALLERQRALAALQPLGWLSLGAGAAWAAVRRHPTRTTVSAGAIAVAVVGGFVLLGPQEEEALQPRAGGGAAAGPATGLSVAGTPADLGAALPTGAATVQDLPVQAVPADEGFWLGDGPGRRVWVEIVGSAESPVQVQAGDRVSFTGQVAGTDAGYADRVGLTPDEGAVELQQSGTRLTVARDDLQVRRP